MGRGDPLYPDDEWVQLVECPRCNYIEELSVSWWADQQLGIAYCDACGETIEFSSSF